MALVLHKGTLALGRLVGCLVLAILLGFPVMGSAAQHVSASASNREVRIGVLALRGTRHALDNWSATATYLNEKIPGYRFQIIPLSFEQIEPHVADKALDFVIVNPVMHVLLAERYGVSPVATLINRLDAYDSSLYGGVIFRPAGMGGNVDLHWLEGKRFLAVDPLSLGGFLAARYELHKNGIDPYRDFASLEFAGTHDAVVLGVLAGRADAGTVRTDVLERMAAEGEIQLSQVEVLGSYRSRDSREHSRFPYLRSTRLYPEWPISMIAGVPDDLARQLAMALLAMPVDSPAAHKAEIVGWNVPMTYIPVVDLLRELGMPPFEQKPVTLGSLIERRPWITAMIALGIIVTSTLTAGLLLLNRRLRHAKRSLVVTNFELEDRVQQRTEALERSESELQQLATHDALTGLWNRRALEARMIEEVNRVNRYGHPLSLLMVDIDFFKKVNDRFGHSAGDMVLKAVAQRLITTLRNTDIVARYGGEEFVILLPMTQERDAMVLAQRLCEAVAGHDIDLGNSQIVRITISIGVAVADKDGNMRSDVLLDAADQAMYAAKMAGRNRVCLAGGV